MCNGFPQELGAIIAIIIALMLFALTVLVIQLIGYILYCRVMFNQWPAQHRRARQQAWEESQRRG